MRSRARVSGIRSRNGRMGPDCTHSAWGFRNPRGFRGPWGFWGAARSGGVRWWVGSGGQGGADAVHRLVDRALRQRGDPIAVAVHGGLEDLLLEVEESLRVAAVQLPSRTHDLVRPAALPEELDGLEQHRVAAGAVEDAEEALIGIQMRDDV